MTTLGNPFPDYPVATLGRIEGSDDHLTVVTPAIEKAEALVDRYLDEPASHLGINVPVRGDFGTGKTHLLRHAVRRLRSRSTERHLIPGVVSVSAMETGPEDWYRDAIGPAVAGLDLGQIGVELFGRAAAEVAGRAPLTANAVTALESNPEAARTLVDRDLLNQTAVEVQLLEMVESATPDTAPDVRRAIVGLATTPTQSARWLAGEALSDREQAATGLPSQMSTDVMLVGALAAVASAHTLLGRPFALVVDELEHFTRADDKSNGKRNVTWLKRLLERLQASGALVLVAGHTEAWETRRDYLDRFAPDAMIDLAPLTAAHVIEIVERHAGATGAFTLANAQLLVDVQGGNVRGVLTVLRDLFGRSEGFKLPIAERTIMQASSEVARRVAPEHAMEQLAHLLAELGLQVERGAAVAGIAFDLVAYRDGEPFAVAELKHALFGLKQQEQVQRFIDKLRVATKRAPDCVGLFLSEGALNAGLMEVDSAAARVLWFDLTEPGFEERVREALESILAAAASATIETSERERHLSSLLTEVQSVKEAQRQIYDELRDRLDSGPASDTADLRFRPPAAEDMHDKRRLLYEELAKVPPLARRLSVMFGPRTFAAVALLTVGVSLLVLSSSLAGGIAHDDASYASIRAVLFGLGAVSVLSGLWLLVRSYILVDRFYAFRQERLRYIYIREFDVGALLDANTILEDGLARYGPVHGREFAADRLMQIGLTTRYDRDEDSFVHGR